MADEGQMHFLSEEEAVKWLNQPFMKNIYDVSYDRTGLVGYWSKTPKRKQLNVGIFQFYINGKKPNALPGANGKVKVISESVSGQP